MLRQTLEAQETRGLTRSDDISRLLPSEAATLARGMTVPTSKLIFYAKLVEKSLQTYERDGWGEFPTQIDIDRREIRPTADRGPILLCVDTSGSMRGPRELVAKALTLECMRAAKIQERGCYVYAFAGPKEVKELELGMDPESIERLLSFLEATFNGGSNFSSPIEACLKKLSQAQWSNSDILIVSDGELRQPKHEIMRYVLSDDVDVSDDVSDDCRTEAARPVLVLVLVLVALALTRSPRIPMHATGRSPEARKSWAFASTV